MKNLTTYFFIVNNNQIVYRSLNRSLCEKEVNGRINVNLYSHTVKWPVLRNLSESDIKSMTKIV